MKFYTVRDDYVSYLKNIDSRVADNYGGGRTYVGIVLEIGGISYLAPLTSYKRKQDSYSSDSPTLYKVHENHNPSNPLGMLQLNNMIPLVDGVYELLDFAGTAEPYRRMLKKQIAFINTNQDDIKARAAKLHELVTVKKHNFYSELSCDFSALEKACATFLATSSAQAVVNVSEPTAVSVTVKKAIVVSAASPVVKMGRATLSLTKKPPQES